MNNILLWLVPPLAGAIIGYVTNAVAIKMLFRPLKEVRVFGIRLPFTPGILPRQRHKLADNIGRMVERELLTPEILRERLFREDVRESIQKAMGDLSGRILDTPLGRLRPGEEPGDDTLGKLLPDLLRSLLRSPAFEGLLEELLRAIMETGSRLGNSSLRDILGGEATEKLREGLPALLDEVLGTNLPKLPGFLGRLLDESYSKIAAWVVEFLNKPEIHGELETQGRVFLQNAMLKLSVFQRFFVSAAQYDRTLHDRMPEIIDDLIGQVHSLLTEKETRQKLIAHVEGFVRDFAVGDRAAQFKPFITDLVMSFTDRPLEEIFRRLPAISPASLAGKIQEFIARAAGGGGEGSLRPALERFLDRYGELRWGEILTLDAARKVRLDGFICDKLLALVDVQIDGLLKTINVRTLVSDRVDSLDMIKVERIVLDVMANQLKWINIFGAILGAFIGLFQAGLSVFLQ
ncbi:MAG: DUF445 family protein [Treponema sp.]|jgi:hypothetical protein|nr:DUF445 family protein [Treponema sp.]